MDKEQGRGDKSAKNVTLSVPAPLNSFFSSSSSLFATMRRGRSVSEVWAIRSGLDGCLASCRLRLRDTQGSARFSRLQQRALELSELSVGVQCESWVTPLDASLQRRGVHGYLRTQVGMTILRILRILHTYLST
jgi:hypothetical protein